MSYAYGKQYYVWVTCMWWCSNTASESVPLLVSNIHDIILVRTQYVLVCIGLYSYSFPVLVCTRYVLVRTGSEPVHTKYPVPVMRLTIPDAVGLEIKSITKKLDRSQIFQLFPYCYVTLNPVRVPNWFVNSCRLPVHVQLELQEGRL